jgi:hypothetical protein
MKKPYEILKDYKPADDSFVINCGNINMTDPDQSLIPIRISLPKPPPIELIAGYGLPYKEQRWVRPEMPYKLISVEKEVRRELELRLKENRNDRISGYKIVEEIWKKIEGDTEYYEEEIKHIRLMWYYRINGYWFFCKGKPTYICGWHFFFLTFWRIDGSFYPDYRDVDRRELLAWNYFKNTKETFKNLDDKGNAIENEFGELETEELLYNTFYGVCEAKARRRGVSNKAQSCQFEVISRSKSTLGAIFSMTGDSASKLFKDITIRAFRHMPFFFLPNWEGYFENSKEIFFNKPKNIVLGEDLQSRIAIAESAYGGEFDGTKIDMAVYDEEGKTKAVDITKRWNTHKRASALGLRILGFSFHISTVEDLDIDGGKHFQRMVYSSNFFNRNDVNGQTNTGLATIFFPAYDGYEECMDYWGYSVIENPTQEQIEAGYKPKYGAKKILQSERDALLNSKNQADKKEYQRLVVKFPFTLDECFQLTNGSVSFNMDKINKRLAELRRIKEPFVRGNFEWVSNRFGDVKFTQDSEGRWEVSKLLNPGEANQKIKSNKYDDLTGQFKELWMPKNPQKGTIGADTTKFKGDRQMAAETGGYQSDSGIAVYQEWDKFVDPIEKAIQDRITDNFVAVYRNRVLSDVFYEDVLMAAIYYGYLLYIENNIDDLWVWIDKVGFGGYLLYDFDEASGKYKPKPGVHQSDITKEKMFKHFQNFVEFRGHMCNHSTLLTEISKLKQPEDLNKLDMASAAGCALLGSNSRARQMLESVDDSMDEIGKSWMSGQIKW